MNLTITLATACIVLVLLIYVITTRTIKLQKEAKALKEEIVKQKEIVVEMYRYADELAMIKKDQSQVNQKINEAKTDEEISNIISGIIAANNNRMRK